MKKITVKKKAAKQEITPEIRLTAPLQAEFLHFIEFHPAGRLSKNLRNLLIEFLMFDGGTEAVFLKDLLYDLMGLYELLDCIEREVVKKRSETE